MDDLKAMKKLVKRLKYEAIGYADCCGEDDPINAIPAKKAYKRAKKIYKHMKEQRIYNAENLYYQATKTE